jgi:hypothetical protein
MAAAVTHGRAGAFAHELQRILPAAAQAAIAADAAVQLNHVPAAGQLVQAVDILRYDREKPAGFFQFGQLKMRGIGPGVGIQHFFPVKSKKQFFVAFIKTAAYDLFRRIGVFLPEQPARAAKIRDAALDGYAGAAEKDDGRTAVEPGL